MHCVVWLLLLCVIGSRLGVCRCSTALLQPIRAEQGPFCGCIHPALHAVPARQGTLQALTETSTNLLMLLLLLLNSKLG